MSEDWKAGDVAVCVDDAPCGHCGTPVPIVRGRHYRVVDVRFGINSINGAALNLSGFAGIPGHRPYISGSRFRKLNDEPDDIALIRKIKACKPARHPIHAGDGQ